MDENVLRLSVVGRIVRRRWRLLVVLAIVGALIGAAASFVLSPGYESSSKVLLQSPRDKSALQTESQIAMSLVVLDRTAKGLGWGESGADLVGVVKSDVVDGNVIEIMAAGHTPQRAQQLAQKATDEYVAFSSQLISDAVNASSQITQQRRAAVQKQIDDASKQIADAQASPAINLPGAEGIQARASLEQLQAGLTSARNELESLDGVSQKDEVQASISRAGISVIEPAGLPTSAASPTLPELAAGGGVVLILLGVFGSLFVLRADRRLRTLADIGAALGAPVLASVDLPPAVQLPEPEGEPLEDEPVYHRDRWSRFRWLLGEDLYWDSVVPTTDSDGRDKVVRYRRVLGRLRPVRAGVRRILVLVPADDAIAARAAAQLSLAAAADNPASVVTDSTMLARAVRSALRADASQAALTVRSGNEPDSGTDSTVLYVVEISVSRPTVPEVGPIEGAILVLAVGSRTGWELVAIAEACVDAGCSLLGAVVVAPRDHLIDEPLGRHSIEATNSRSVEHLIAGSA